MEQFVVMADEALLLNFYGKFTTTNARFQICSGNFT